MVLFQPFVELPPKWALTSKEAALLRRTQRLLESMRNQHDSNALGRAEAAIHDIIAEDIQ